MLLINKMIKIFYIRSSTRSNLKYNHRSILQSYQIAILVSFFLVLYEQLIITLDNIYCNGIIILGRFVKDKGELSNPIVSPFKGVKSCMEINLFDKILPVPVNLPF